jgi:hypothetical protein
MHAVTLHVIPICQAKALRAWPASDFGMGTVDRLSGHPNVTEQRNLSSRPGGGYGADLTDLYRE